MGRKINTNNRTVQDILLLEGRTRPLQFLYTNTNPTLSMSNGVTIATMNSTPGYVSFLYQIEVSCTKGCDIEFVVGNVSGVQSEDSFKTKIRKRFTRGVHTIQVNSFVYQGLSTSNPLIVYIYEVYNDDSTVSPDKSIVCNVQLVAREIYEDYEFFNPNAKQCIWIGDSVMRGTPSISQKELHYIWKAKLELRKKGIQTRMCCRALGGSTSIEHDKYLTKGLYDTEEWDYIFWGLGVNDTSNASYIADYTKALTNVINWKKTRFPSSKLIILAPHRNLFAANEAKYANIRTIASSLVSVENSANILLCNMGQFDLSTISGAYYSDTPTPLGVHLTDVGYAALWDNVLQPFIAQL